MHRLRNSPVIPLVSLSIAAGSVTSVIFSLFFDLSLEQSSGRSMHAIVSESQCFFFQIFFFTLSSKQISFLLKSWTGAFFFLSFFLYVLNVPPPIEFFFKFCSLLFFPKLSLFFLSFLLSFFFRTLEESPSISTLLLDNQQQQNSSLNLFGLNCTYAENQETKKFQPSSVSACTLSWRRHKPKRQAKHFWFY